MAVPFSSVLAAVGGACTSLPIGADVPAPACAFSGILGTALTGPSSQPSEPAALIEPALVLSPFGMERVFTTGLGFEADLEADLPWLKSDLEALAFAFDLIAEEAEV